MEAYISHDNDVTDRRAANVPPMGLFAFIFPTGWYGYVNKTLSHG